MKTTIIAIVVALMLTTPTTAATKLDNQIYSFTIALEVLREVCKEDKMNIPCAKAVIELQATLILLLKKKAYP